MLCSVHGPQLAKVVCNHCKAPAGPVPSTVLMEFRGERGSQQPGMFQLPVQAAPAPPSAPAASLEPRAAGPSPSPCSWATVDSADRGPAPQQPPMAYSPRALLRAAGRGSCTECWWWFLGGSSRRFPTIANGIESDVGPSQGAARPRQQLANSRTASRGPGFAGGRLWVLWEAAMAIGAERAAQAEHSHSTSPGARPAASACAASCRCLQLFRCLCTPGLLAAPPHLCGGRCHPARLPAGAWRHMECASAGRAGSRPAPPPWLPDPVGAMAA